MGKIPISEKNLQFIPIYAYSWLRSLNFTLQSAILPYVDLLATQEKRESPKDFNQHIKDALPKINKLLLQDSQNIVDGYYPKEVLVTENIFDHALRLPLVIRETFKSSQRRKKNVNKNFDGDTENLVEKMPDYYARNFHYQNSGYLSSESAKLYEHQVELLFSGAANAMRRLVLVDLKKRLNYSDGEDLNFLEIGSGTGALTQFVALAFPKASITCVDLSPYYLQEAKQKLKKFKRINFMAANAEELPFKDKSFDVIYSCFLFHELPAKVRSKIMNESVRVAKPEALIAAVDSLQKGDDENFQWALSQFPKDFHEPFYKNYTENPLETLFSQSGLTEVENRIGFLSKSVIGKLNLK